MRMIGQYMTPDEGRQFDEILSHGSMLNVSEKFLVNLVFTLGAEVDRVLHAKLRAVRDEQHRCCIEHQQKQKAIAGMTPLQYIIVVASFLVLYLLNIITIGETRAIGEELAQIKSFQQNTVGPMHQHILDKLTKLAPDEK